MAQQEVYSLVEVARQVLAVEVHTLQQRLSEAVELQGRKLFIRLAEVLKGEFFSLLVGHSRGDRLEFAIVAHDGGNSERLASLGFLVLANEP